MEKSFSLLETILDNEFCKSCVTGSSSFMNPTTFACICCSPGSQDEGGRTKQSEQFRYCAQSLISQTKGSTEYIEVVGRDSNFIIDSDFSSDTSSHRDQENTNFEYEILLVPCLLCGVDLWGCSAQLHSGCPTSLHLWKRIGWIYEITFNALSPTAMHSLTISGL